MRWFMATIVAGLVLLMVPFEQGPGSDGPPRLPASAPVGQPDPWVPPVQKTDGKPREPSFAAGSWLVWPHPHGKAYCASGCVPSNHPTPALDEPHFRSLLAGYAGEPIAETSPALEALLFYGRQTRRLLESSGPGPLDAPRTELLRRELARAEALVSFRLVDDRQHVWAHFAEARVPLDIRHVYDVESAELPPLVASGTAKRVGLHHLWTRI